MVLLARKLPPRPRGEILGWLITLYGAFRISVEFFREPDVQIGFLVRFTAAGGGVTMGQLLSVPMVLLGVWLIWRSRKLGLPQQGPGSPGACARALRSPARHGALEASNRLARPQLARRLRRCAEESGQVADDVLEIRIVVGPGNWLLDHMKQAARHGCSAFSKRLAPPAASSLNNEGPTAAILEHYLLLFIGVFRGGV